MTEGLKSRATRDRRSVKTHFFCLTQIDPENEDHGCDEEGDEDAVGTVRPLPSAVFQVPVCKRRGGVAICQESKLRYSDDEHPVAQGSHVGDDDADSVSKTSFADGIEHGSSRIGLDVWARAFDYCACSCVRTDSPLGGKKRNDAPIMKKMTMIIRPWIRPQMLMILLMTRVETAPKIFCSR